MANFQALVHYSQYILQNSQEKPQVPYNYVFVKTSSYEIRSLGCLQGLWQRRDMKTSSFQLAVLQPDYSCLKYGFNPETPLLHNQQHTHPSAWDWAANIRLVPKVLVSDVIFWANEHTARPIRATWHCCTNTYKRIRQVLKFTAINIYSASIGRVPWQKSDINISLQINQRRDMKVAHHMYITSSVFSQTHSYWKDSWLGHTCDEEVAMLFQSITVLAHYMIESQV